MKIDRTGWPQGEWDSEPDAVEWRTGAFWCSIQRSRMGHLCGYLGVGPEHPWHGLRPHEVHRLCPELRVHGGLTYANPATAEEPPGFWVLGFDCGHGYDLSPLTPSAFRRVSLRDQERVYRPLRYLIEGVAELVRGAGGQVRSDPHLQLWDGEVRVFAHTDSATGTVTGVGADLLREWVRFGQSDLAVVADWLEDYPESVRGLSAAQVGEVAQVLRREATIPDTEGGSPT